MLLRTLALLIVLGQGLSAYELSVIAMFKNEGPYLKEWVKYHQLAGVDYFYLFDNCSTDEGVAVLQPFVDEGLVELIDWPFVSDEFPPTAGSHVKFQLAAYREGMVRDNHKSKWVAFIDIDEFIVPLKEKNIPESLSTYFEGADAVFLNWRNFGTSFINVPHGEPFLSKLILCSMPTHSDNCIGKSIVKAQSMNIDNIWYPHHFVLLPGCRYVNGINKPMNQRDNDLFPDSKHYNKYLVIHHYCLRDEWFYNNVRLAKAKKGIGEMHKLVEHYDNFNVIPNYDAINYLKKNHPKEFAEYWE